MHPLPGHPWRDRPTAAAATIPRWRPARRDGSGSRRSRWPGSATQPGARSPGAPASSWPTRWSIRRACCCSTPGSGPARPTSRRPTTRLCRICRSLLSRRGLEPDDVVALACSHLHFDQPARTPRSRVARSTSRRPSARRHERPTTRSTRGSTSPAHATSRRTARRSSFRVSGSSRRPATHRPPVAGRRQGRRADRTRRAGALHASGVGWRERAGRVRPRERVGSGRLPCIRGASASAPARRRSVRSRQVGGSIRVRVRYSDLWGCVVSTGPGYRGTRAEDATGPR